MKKSRRFFAAAAEASSAAAADSDHKHENFNLEQLVVKLNGIEQKTIDWKKT